MEIDSLIEQGMTYRQNPETDYKGEPTWVAKAYREDFFQWRMRALTTPTNTPSTPVSHAAYLDTIHSV